MFGAVASFLQPGRQDPGLPGMDPKRSRLERCPIQIMSDTLITAHAADLERSTTASTHAAPTVSERLRSDRLLVAVALAAATLLFWPTLAGLWDQWMGDPDFSHGIVIVGVSAALIYTKRGELGSMAARRSLVGLSILLVSLLVYAIGYRTMTRVFERLGMWGVVVGSVWFLLGTRFIFKRPFPYFYLLLSIPPPFIVMAPVRLVLKNFATRLSSDALVLLGIPAMPEGNILAVGESRLEVADACSGIRSLMAVTATAVLLAYLFRMGAWKGAVLTAIAVPITVLVNVLRLVVVAVALTRFEIDLTGGWPHDMVGFAVFGVSLALLFATARFVEWFFRWNSAEEVGS